MNRFFAITFLFVLTVPSFALAADEEFDANGTNVVRVENEDKITVPNEMNEEVWKYIEDRFVNNPSIVKEFDPALSTYTETEQFNDTYYDSPTLQLLEMQSGVRHRWRTSLTNENNRKNDRELMQIKMNHIDPNDPLSRGEIKFDILYPTQIQSMEDSHPMIGIVQPDQREDFMDRVRDMGVDPYVMKPILTVPDLRRRVYFTMSGVTIFSISYDTVTAKLHWAEANFTEIEPEINEIQYTEASDDKAQYLKDLQSLIIDDVMAKYPELKRDLTPKYNKSFAKFQEQIPFLRLWVRLGTEGLVAAVVLPVLVILIVIVGVVKKRGRKVV